MVMITEKKPKKDKKHKKDKKTEKRELAEKTALHDVNNDNDEADADLEPKEERVQEKVEGEEEPESHDEEDGDTKKKRRRKRKRSKKPQEKGQEDDDNKATSAESAPSGSGDDETARTVFVEGVPYDATVEEIAECLQQHAKIDRSDITELRFATWQDSGRLRGFGHVVFSSVDICKKALQIAASQKIWLRKRYLSLQSARPKGLGGALHQDNDSSISQPSSTIMIKNLAYEATEEDIEQVMKQFGAIETGGVRIARNFQTRHNKGFAYVDYADLASAKSAMEHYQESISDPSKGLSILNRPCRLDYDSGRIKGSFKTSAGRLWSREFNGPNHSHHDQRQRP